ncbi:DUF4124 domain-containing protein [Aquirhabdus sp.]|uniref:DUF4124 domain-containing protein n=1 Tax=Aquirhabdus sp. TaxID=2824160 RepID=UPI00396C7E97
MKKWILTLTPVITLIMSVGMSYAQPFYKWTDEQGSTHYTQTPPPQKQVKKLDVNTHVPTDSASEIKKLSALSSANQKAVAADEKAAAKSKEEAAADAERRRKNSDACVQLKASLTQLQSGQRLRTYGADGERVYLTEEDKASRIQQQTTQIQNDCPK